MTLEELGRQVYDLRKALGDRIAGIWPVGSVFLSIVATSPATLLGFGTWSQIASGKFLVGQDGTDAAFDVAEEIGGAKTKNLAHAHAQGTLGAGHTHPVNPPNTNTSTASAGATSSGSYADDITDINHTHGVDIAEFNSGAASAFTGETAGAGSATQDILPPYFVVYCWKRTA